MASILYNFFSYFMLARLKLYIKHVSLLSPGQLAPHVCYFMYVFLLFYAFVCGANKFIDWLIDWLMWNTYNLKETNTAVVVKF